MPSTTITTKNKKANNAKAGATARRIKNNNICNITKQ